MLKQWLFIATLSLLCGVTMLSVNIKQSEPIEIPPATTTTTELSQSLGTYRITSYTTYESCHNPKNNSCLMADGTPTKIGAVACPSSFKLGTELLIDGKKYICQDRYATYLSPRFDIFLGDGEDNYLKAKEFGVKYLEVKIIK